MSCNIFVTFYRFLKKNLIYTESLVCCIIVHWTGTECFFRHKPSIKLWRSHFCAFAMGVGSLSHLVFYSSILQCLSDESPSVLYLVLQAQGHCFPSSAFMTCQLKNVCRFFTVPSPLLMCFTSHVAPWQHSAQKVWKYVLNRLRHCRYFWIFVYLHW